MIRRLVGFVAAALEVCTATVAPAQGLLGVYGYHPASAYAVARSPYVFTKMEENWGDSTTAGVGAAVGYDYPSQLRALVTSGPTGQVCLGASGSIVATYNYACNNGYAGRSTHWLLTAIQGLATAASFTGYTVSTTLHVTAMTSGTIVPLNQPLLYGGALKSWILSTTTTAGGDVATYTLVQAPPATIGTSGAPVAMTAGNPSESSRTQIFGGGLNDYNYAAVGATDYTKDWPGPAEANFASMASLVTGGADYGFLLAWAVDTNVDGLVQGANFVYHRRQMLATYGGRIIDWQRVARDQWSVAGTTAGPDWYSTQIMGTIPASYRNLSSAGQPPYNDAATILGTVDPGTSPTTATTAASAGQVFGNTSATTISVKTGAAGTDTWQSFTDYKHLNNRGYASVATSVADYTNAGNGNGPPWVPAQEAKIAADAAIGTPIASLAYHGSVTGCAVTNKNGSAQTVISASATCQLTTAVASQTEGWAQYTVWASNAKGTLAAPFDLYVGRASTNTTPTRILIPQAGAVVAGNTITGGIVVQGREGHAMPVSSQLSGAFYVKFDTIANAPYILNLGAGQNATQTGNLPTTLKFTIQSSGKMSFVGTNAAGTASVNVTCTTGLTTGTWYWLLFSFDASTNTFQCYVNDTSFTPTKTTFSAGSFNWPDTVPAFFAAAGPKLYTPATSPLFGGFALAMVTPTFVDWSVAATRRQVFDTSFNPVARTPYTAIGPSGSAVVPFYDLSGGKGDWLYGLSNSSNPETLMIPSYNARWVMN